MYRIITATIFIILGLFATLTSQEVPPFIDTLDEYIQRNMEEWGIPGLAISIVKDDEIVYMKGFGVRKLGSNDEVDKFTLFGIASLTKAFTGTALGILVEQGKLNWDDPVAKYIPEFQLSDPWVTREITIRDLLTHKSGLGRMIGNRLQFMTNRDRAELMYRLRYLPFERSFRSSYVYSNMAFMVAGEVIQRVTGLSWDDFVVENIFRPLGMNQSSTRIGHLLKQKNIAYPHQEIDGKIQVIPHRSFDNVGPAGSINSNVFEMAQWMRFNLGEPGKYNGNMLLSGRIMRDIHHPQTVVPVNNPYEEFTAYGLGWGIRLYNEKIILRHAGASDGMNSIIVLVPELNLGIVVLTNIFSDFIYGLVNQIIDSYLGISERDWNQHYLLRYLAQFELTTQRREAIHAARHTETSPSLPLEGYVGKYYDQLYGNVEVVLDDTVLRIIFWDDTTLTADLEHWHYDTFRAIWKNRAQREKFVWFDLGRSGEVVVLNIEFNLRPNMIQVGVYPSDYTRVVRFERIKE